MLKWNIESPQALSHLSWWLPAPGRGGRWPWLLSWPGVLRWGHLPALSSHRMFVWRPGCRRGWTGEYLSVGPRLTLIPLVCCWQSWLWRGSAFSLPSLHHSSTEDHRGLHTPLLPPSTSSTTDSVREHGTRDNFWAFEFSSRAGAGRHLWENINLFQATLYL